MEGGEGGGLAGRDAVDAEEGRVEGKDEGEGVGEGADGEDGLGCGEGGGEGPGEDGFAPLRSASEPVEVFSKSGNWFLKGCLGISSKLGKVRSPSWGPKKPAGSSLSPAKALALTTLVGFFRLGSFGKVKPGAPRGSFGGRLEGRGPPLAGRGRGRARAGCPWSPPPKPPMSKGKLSKPAGKSSGKLGKAKSPGNLWPPAVAGGVLGRAEGFRKPPPGMRLKP